MTALWHVHRNCRVCGEPLGESYLHLGEQPLANALRDKRDDPEVTAPLAVALCTTCGLSQLTVVVAPNVLYGNYPFFSGASPRWVAHCEQLARDCATDNPSFVLDIAANDGTQLKAFADREWRTVGIDPSDVPPVFDTPMIRAPFDALSAAEVLASYGRPNLIIAQNVFGHVDDAVGFLRCAESILADGGRIAIEVPHVRDLIQQDAFDTIYHEHLSYWSTSPLIRCARQAGLHLEKMERLDIHGGSRRYWLGRRTEQPYDFGPTLPADERPYLQFAHRVAKKLHAIKATLEAHRSERLWAYGASAKGTVMLNALKSIGNEVWPEVILDDTRAKQHKVSPGLHIPIQPSMRLRMLTQPDLLWLLSWNVADNLRQRARELGYEGKFLVSSPTIEVH